MSQIDGDIESESLPDEALSPAEQRFELWRRRAGVVLTPVAFALTYWLCDGLSAEGRKLASILASVGVLWMSEVIPLPVTALVGAILCVVLGVAPAKTVLQYFADPIVFVFIGGFILARAMTIHRLDRRIALAFLSIRWIGRHPATMLGGLGLVTAILSMWVSNTATTAMMLPIALGVLGALHQVRVSEGLAKGPMNPRNWPYATGMMLMIAYAASIGGIGTPVGSPPNLIGIGLIRRTAGFEISFFKWMALCIPLFVVMGAFLLVLLWWLHPAKEETTGKSGRGLGAGMLQYITREYDRLGGWTWGQTNTLIAFGIAVFLWVLPGVLALPIWGGGELAQDAAMLGTWMSARLPESVVALIAAVLLFMLPVNLPEGRFTLTWADAVKIDWGTILLFGGGLSLGTLMFDTGVAAAMGNAVTRQIGASDVWTLTAVSIVIAIFLSETTSNTASANMIIPVVIALAQTAGVSPIPPALGACLGASYGFMLPVSTPPNAIAYGSGLVPIARMMRAGILFDIFGAILIFVGLRILCPALGLI
jgi:sodium-dependent dicarboxylate transporter 2/3/5